jgi:hypothetical protein
MMLMSHRPDCRSDNRGTLRGEFGLRVRMHCSILSGSLEFLTRKGGECNQSCKQYRSDNSINP